MATSLFFFRACSPDCFDIPPQTYVECETYSLKKGSNPIKWIALVHPSKNLVGAIALNKPTEPFLTGLYVPEYRSRLEFTKRGLFWVSNNPEFSDSYLSARCLKNEILLEHYSEGNFTGFVWEAVCDRSLEKCDVFQSMSSESGMAIGYSVCKVKNLENLLSNRLDRI